MSIVSLNKLEVNGFKAKVSNKLKFYKKMSLYTLSITKHVTKLSFCYMFFA